MMHIHIWLPFYLIELQLASADGTADGVYRQWFLEVFLGPFSNVNDRIMPMSNAVSSEGLVPYAQRFLQFLRIF